MPKKIKQRELIAAKAGKSGHHGTARRIEEILRRSIDRAR
jgi:hypothetical protein